MKGKNLSGKNGFDLGIGGLATGFGGMFFKSDYKERVVENTVGKNFIVDTAFVRDTNLYETAIQYKTFNEGAWIIVDEFKTKEKAERQHKAWVEFMRTQPTELKDIHTDEIFNS